MKNMITGSLLQCGLLKLNRCASFSREIIVPHFLSLKGTLNIQPSHLMQKYYQWNSLDSVLLQFSKYVAVIDLQVHQL